MPRRGNCHLPKNSAQRSRSVPRVGARPLRPGRQRPAPPGSGDRERDETIPNSWREEGEEKPPAELRRSALAGRAAPSDPTRSDPCRAEPSRAAPRPRPAHLRTGRAPAAPTRGSPAPRGRALQPGPSRGGCGVPGKLGWAGLAVPSRESRGRARAELRRAERAAVPEQPEPRARRRRRPLLPPRPPHRPRLLKRPRVRAPAPGTVRTAPGAGTAPGTGSGAPPGFASRPPPPPPGKESSGFRLPWPLSASFLQRSSSGPAQHGRVLPLSSQQGEAGQDAAYFILQFATGDQP